MQGVLKLWINAFIPRDVPNYTRTIAAGEHGGKTAVPLPLIARGHPRNLFKPWNEGFLTDQRGFSDQQTASVRMQSAATVQVSPAGLRASIDAPKTSGTISVDLKSGKQLGSAGADLNKCSMDIYHGPSTRLNMLTGQWIDEGAQSIILAIYAAGSDPLVAASADIDYTGNWQVIHHPQKNYLAVLFKGKIDDFPAFEAYAQFNNSTQTLFTAPPPKGNTVVDLLGDAKRPVTGDVSWPMR